VAGYSDTPQLRKLGLKEGLRAQVVGRPAGWTFEAEPLGIDWVTDGSVDLVLVFVRTASEFLALFPTLIDRIRPAGMIWIAWPRKAAGHVSDMTDNLIRDTAIETGLVDVKVAAIDEDWSGLKVVWRVSNR